MSRQKHDLGRIKKTQAPAHNAKARAEKKKERSQRVSDAYARAEAEFQRLQNASRDKHTGR
jgi:hypothetical protein